ncbi:enolase 4 isoform X2 [Myripristis murdjan]|uniref:enolase 4 isoform X2 n=1 Tax=Myripristis murdjan TaxID=586833 RepID=UPI00117631A3|nr:enolase 4 isoform X2 [Myripristis murdjan]
MACDGFRRSKEKRDLSDMKSKAAEFYQGNGVPQEIERALNHLFFHQSGDIYGDLANYFTKLAAPPRISKLKGKEVYDARGQLSIQAEVFCIIRNEEKLFSSAAISNDCGLLEETSAGLSAKSEERFNHVMTALQWINEPLSEMLKDLDPCDQAGVDHILSNFFMARYLEKEEIQSREREQSCSPSKLEEEPPTPPPAQPKGRKSGDKGKKGTNVEKPIPPREPPEPVLPGSWAIGSVSLAVAKTGAQIQGVPLYKYIAALKNQEAQTQFHVPVSLVTLLSCGKTSPGKLNLLEEVILIPAAGQQVKQIITMALELQNELMRIMNTSSKAGAVQAALSDTGALAVGCERPEQPLDLIAEACSDLGLALGTEIHLAVNCAAHELMDYDVEQWDKLSSAIGGSCLLLSDVTTKPQTPPLPGVKGHILRQMNETSISDLIRITSDYQGAVIMGTTCREPCSDDSLSDVAVGLGLSYVKLGGLSGGERLTKYNRLISIEEELAQQGILVSKENRPTQLFGEKPEEQQTAP